ncbi:MAG TPA: mycothiol conjugate amidase Mca [Candidatus Nanopelagicales bacterium]
MSPDPTVAAVTGQPPERLRLLAVHAHPDDESSKGAASMARYAQEGVEVLVVSCTGGERGDILNPALAEELAGVEDLSEVRRAEMARAAQILGVQHRWLGFVDSGLPEGDPLPPVPEGSFAAIPLQEAAAALVAVVREFRPHVITTYDENGGYPHPDHMRTHEISMIAYESAGDPDAFPGTGEPWPPRKLYYHLTFHKARLEALDAAARSSGLDSPFQEWLANWEDKPEDADRLTTRVPCGDWFEARDAALLAHATQVDPNGRWFAVPLDVQRAAWDTEDFQLARSRVATVIGADGLEHDLFSGLRAPQSDASAAAG